MIIQRSTLGTLTETYLTQRVSKAIRFFCVCEWKWAVHAKLTHYYSSCSSSSMLIRNCCVVFAFWHFVSTLLSWTEILFAAWKLCQITPKIAQFRERKIQNKMPRVKVSNRVEHRAEQKQCDIKLKENSTAPPLNSPFRHLAVCHCRCHHHHHCRFLCVSLSFKLYYCYDVSLSHSLVHLCFFCSPERRRKKKKHWNELQQ